MVLEPNRQPIQRLANGNEDGRVKEVTDHWLPRIASGESNWTEFAEHLLMTEYPSIRHDQPDRDRVRRCGFGEVIYGEGKSVATIIAIANRLLQGTPSGVLVTRVGAESVPELSAAFSYSRYDALGRTLVLGNRTSNPANSPASDEKSPSCQFARVSVVCAGSTDRPVAREAAETLRWMGVPVELVSDIGVAGPYRLLPHLERLRSAAAVVVVAGMEGALASVMGGLVPCPIIAVPTSVGYGANLQGVTTMLSMLSSCAAGVSVVNVDAGFKGGYVAGLIAHRVEKAIQGIMHRGE